VLLRLKPGPDESLFGITAAPTIVVSDWYGRVVAADLNLRGDVPAACRRLAQALASFDAEKAARPPYAPPEGAKPLVAADGAAAMEALLASLRPAKGGKPPRGKSFAALAEVYRSLELDGELIRFCANYFAACGARAPTGEEETDLLAEMTYCRNDRVKFEAIAAFAKAAPPARAGFFARRVEEKAKDCLNPNRVLCASLEGVGIMAARLPPVTDRASAECRKAVVDSLPLLARAMAEEARNNAACRLARDSALKIVEATGAPEALAAAVHALESPGVTNDQVRGMTEKFAAESRERLVALTGWADLGTDYAAWARRCEEKKDVLVYDPSAKRFVENAAAAKAFRAKLAAALRGM
jgi:hypothetical protein